MKPMDPESYARLGQPLPETLSKFLEDEAQKPLPAQDWKYRGGGAHADIVYRRRHAQGQLTASVHGSHVRVTVSLRRGLWMLLNLLPTGDQLCDAAEYMARSLAKRRNLLSFALVAMVLYLAIEIGSAFLPAGAVERVLGGWAVTTTTQVILTPAQITVFESRADLLTRNLKAACTLLQKRKFLYQSEIDSLARVAGDVITQLAEVSHANQD